MNNSSNHKFLPDLVRDNIRHFANALMLGIFTGYQDKNILKLRKLDNLIVEYRCLLVHLHYLRKPISIDRA